MRRGVRPVLRCVRAGNARPRSSPRVASRGTRLACANPVTSIPPALIPPPGATPAPVAETQSTAKMIAAAILLVLSSSAGTRLLGGNDELAAKVAAVEARVTAIERIHRDDALLKKAMERLTNKLEKTPP